VTQWHSLDRSEQARYYEMAKREKMLHKQLFPGWTARDNYSFIVRRVRRKAVMSRRSALHRLNNQRGSALCRCRNVQVIIKLECGPMPNVMAALSNIRGALCSTPQSLADAHY